MDYFYGFCPLSPWTESIDSMEIIHGLEKIHGHTGKNQWTFSMGSLEFVHCFCSNTLAELCQWFPWILSTDSMDFLRMGWVEKNNFIKLSIFFTLIKMSYTYMYMQE